MVHIMLPFLVLPLLRRDARIDRDLLKAAANLGASPARAFWHGVPAACRCRASWPAALIVFILCLGFYVTPAVLGGGKVIMVSIAHRQRHRAVLQLGRGQRAGRGAAGADAGVAVGGDAAAAAGAGAGRGASMSWLDRAASDTQVTHRQRLWLYALAALVLAFLVAAHADRHPDVVLGLAVPGVPAARMVAALVRATTWARPSWMQATATSFRPAR